VDTHHIMDYLQQLYKKNIDKFVIDSGVHETNPDAILPASVQIIDPTEDNFNDEEDLGEASAAPKDAESMVNESESNESETAERPNARCILM